MFVRWLLAALHLLALAIGSGGIWSRTVALRTVPFDAAAVRRVLKADTFWGIAALLWLSTGLLRLLGPFEKGSYYYLHNPLFHAKMALFLLILAFEIKPMLAFIRWRRAIARGEAPDTTLAPAFARASMIQSHIMVVMILLAAAIARGIAG